MNWALIVQTLGIVIGGGISFYQVRNLLPGSRATLKADLEILKLLEPQEANYKLVKAHIDASLQRIYPLTNETGGKPAKVIDKVLLGYFIVHTLIFVGWTLYILRNGFSGWGLVTTAFAIVGMLGFIGVLSPDTKSQYSSNKA
jgi:hypothetical protein